MIIPFFIPHAGCKHQCVFCDQRSISGHMHPPAPATVGNTISAFLAHRAVHRGSSDREHGSNDIIKDHVEVAFFGGSFTALPLADQEAYLEQVQPFISSGAVSEIRVSTRPDAISLEVLGRLKCFHVKTVELGVQSMDDHVLLRSGRGHRTEDTVCSVSHLRQWGFHVGIQLMAGLPGDSEPLFLDTIRRTIALRPDFVRIHPALVISGTPLERLYRSGDYSPLSLDDAIVLCSRALLLFREARIPIIRMGLQPSEELSRPGTIVAGPYHPAFRQLVESYVFLSSMRTLLERRTAPGAEAVFLVNRADLTAAVGHGQKNIRRLGEEFGLAVHIREQSTLGRGMIVLQDHRAERAGNMI